MPAPIIPAPRIPSFFTLEGGTPAGRDAPFLIALSWYHRAPIMLRLSCDIAQAAK